MEMEGFVSDDEEKNSPSFEIETQRIFCIRIDPARLLGKEVKSNDEKGGKKSKRMCFEPQWRSLWLQWTRTPPQGTE
jgi:hypothetical protein